jgi:CelD/BcsL family acetyltransferase involved in cellulose biosynthesis
MAHSNQLRHVFYEERFPPELEPALISLYRSVFCVKEHFDCATGQGRPAAVAVYAGGAEPLQVLFYTITGGELTVLNELFGIEEELLRYLAGALFAQYPKVHSIHLNRLTTEIADPGYPSRLWNTSCDIVVQLPGTLEEYRARLGKHTKSNMNNYSNKLRKDHDDYAFHVATGSEVDPAAVKSIIEMNRLRMDSKMVRSAFDDELEARTLRLASRYGVVATINIDGAIAAGTVCYQVGDHCYADIIAHDPRFSRYSIGQVCIYLTIKTLIERGVRAFHMSDGENEYKFRFLGEKQEVYFLSLFRAERYKLLSALTNFSRLRQVVFLKGLFDQLVRSARTGWKRDRK